MKKRLTLGWMLMGLGISAIAFSSPVTSLEEIQSYTPTLVQYLPVTSLLLPQAMPIPETHSNQLLSKHGTWGFSGDLMLMGCAMASLLFARKYRLRLLSEQESSSEIYSAPQA